MSVHLTYAKHLAKMVSATLNVQSFRFTGKNKIGHIHFAFLTGCFQGNFHEAERWFKKAQVLNKSDHASWTHYGMFSSLQERSFIF